MSSQLEPAPERPKQGRKKLSSIEHDILMVIVIAGVIMLIVAFLAIHHVAQNPVIRYSDNPHNADIIGRALLLYYEGSDGCLPPAERWGTALQPLVDRVLKKDELDWSMRDGYKEASYVGRQFNIVKWDREPFAMNRALSGFNVIAILFPEQVVAFFETSECIPNQSGDQSLQLAPYGEHKMIVYVMADGTRLITKHAQDGSGRLVDRYGKPVTIRWKP